MTVQSHAALRCHLHAATTDSCRVTLPCSALAAGYGIDSLLVSDSTHLSHWLDTLSDKQPANLANQCTLLNTKVQHFINSLRNNYTIHEGILHLDSTTCVVGAEEYITKLTQLSALLGRRTLEYDRQERARMVAEIKAAEQRARQKEAEEQRRRNATLDSLKLIVTTKHTSIGSTTDGVGQTKEQQRKLKAIYYGYLTIYNQYDLSVTEATQAHISKIEELVAFQTHLYDSLLGPNSYEQRINNFPNTLRVRCGKNHTQVYKSYLKTFRQIDVPIKFTNLEQYRQYINELSTVIAVQHQYLQSIALLDAIESKSVEVQTRSAKHHAVLQSYKAAEHNLDKTPAFTTLGESNRFMNRMQDFLEVQAAYISSIEHIEEIERHSTRILAACNRYTTDVATAYRELLRSYNMVPDFESQDGAVFFHKTLTDFDRMQEQYDTVIALRNHIQQTEDSLLHNKSIPREITSGYTAIKKQNTLTPNFASISSGDAFIIELRKFATLQQRIVNIVAKQATIDQLNNEIKSANRNNSNTVKAYNTLRKEIIRENVVASESDLTYYERYQDEQMHLATRVQQVLTSSERAEINNRLRRVKELDKIKLILAL